MNEQSIYFRTKVRTNNKPPEVKPGSLLEKAKADYDKLKQDRDKK